MSGRANGTPAINASSPMFSDKKSKRRRLCVPFGMHPSWTSVSSPTYPCWMVKLRTEGVKLGPAVAKLERRVSAIVLSVRMLMEPSFMMWAVSRCRGVVWCDGGVWGG